MPQDAVVRLQHPVVLVGEVEELAGNPLALQRRKRREAAGFDDAEVLAAVDNERRGLPVFHEVHRVVLGVPLRVVPRRSPVLPLGEPQLFGRVVREPFVEIAVVSHEALEPVGPIPRDPVDHVAAVARPQRGDVGPVHPRVLREGRVEPFLQILERLAAPVSVDRVGERLAVAGRAVEIDHDRSVAAAGVGLRVPAIVKVVAERALRAAVNQEGDRVLLGGVEIHGLDDVGVDRVALCALERELLGLAHPRGRQPRFVDRRERLAVSAVRSNGVHFRRALQAVEQEDDAAPGDLRRDHVPRADNRARFSGRGVDCEQRVLPEIVRGAEELLPVGRKSEVGGRAIPALGQDALISVGPGAKHDAEPVPFVPRTFHRKVGERLPVGRKHRVRVPRGVRLGEIFRLGARIDRREEEIEVGGPRLLAPDITRGEHEPLAVRREGVLLGPAERFRRRVGIHRVHDVDGISASGGHHEEVGAAAVGPRVPVPHEEAVVDLPRGLLRRLVIEPLFRLGDGRAGEHLHRQRQRRAVRGNDE